MEISRQFSAVDVISHSSEAARPHQLQTYQHRISKRDYGSGPFTNNHAGAAIAISNRFRIKCVTAPPSLPPCIQGRAGAVRLRRGELDTNFIAASLPPLSGLAKHHNAW
eukprot:8361089-Pyramimonas_sp.AAC.1